MIDRSYRRVDASGSRRVDDWPHPDAANLLVELAFRWADIETEVRVLNPTLGRALEKATRVEAVAEEFDADSGLPLDDAASLHHDSGNYAWTPRAIHVIGSYIVRFDLPRDRDALSLVGDDATLENLVKRYTEGLSVFHFVGVGAEWGGHRLVGQVCRRPAATLPSRVPKTPKLKRGRHSLTPIEARFYDELKETGLVFAAQVTIEGPGKVYRPDFVVFFRGGAVAVELDGHEAHASREQRQHDAEKDRWLQRQGFRSARWTGTDVHRDARSCVSQLVELVRSFDRAADA